MFGETKGFATQARKLGIDTDRIVWIHALELAEGHKLGAGRDDLLVRAAWETMKREIKRILRTDRSVVCAWRSDIRTLAYSMDDRWGLDLASTLDTEAREEHERTRTA
jgi:hypothetical protein